MISSLVVFFTRQLPWKMVIAQQCTNKPECVDEFCFKRYTDSDNTFLTLQKCVLTVFCCLQMSREKSRQFLARATPTSDKSYISQQQISLLKQQHADEIDEKQQLIAQLRATLQDFETQNSRLRTLRRGITRCSFFLVAMFSCLWIILI